ncbi:MAG: MarR family transcriptional regulator [Fimbriimonadaceae bacterium]|nr:MarR family transcriptional regulator [Fimbriimonadaceae bacterium]
MTKVQLGQAQKEAWGSFLVAHSRLTKAIDAALLAEDLPSLEVYDVLLALEDAPDQRLTMSDLANAVVFSRSGLTRLVDRLEQQDLVRRCAHPRDRRSLYAVLTPTGLKKREESWPRYAELIHEHFGRFIPNEEAQAMRDALKRATSAHVNSDEAAREPSITGESPAKR